jgi:hypothetical protein
VDKVPLLAVVNTSSTKGEEFLGLMANEDSSACRYMKVPYQYFSEHSTCRPLLTL